LNYRKALEAAALVLTSAFLYWGGYELQRLLLEFTEHIPGVNWFYLPSGLRVIIVLIAGIYGAAGIAISTVAIDLLYVPDLKGILLLLTAVASGGSAYLTLVILRITGGLTKNLRGLTTQKLLKFSFAYAVINTLLHQVFWWTSGRENSLLMVDVWPMFVGDLTGAVVLLFSLGICMRYLRDMGREKG